MTFEQFLKKNMKRIGRLERDQTVIWAPSKGNWVRARLLFHGQKYDRVQFVDGKGGKGKRSPLSYRSRDPRERGADKPWEDARYSGNYDRTWFCFDLSKLPVDREIASATLSIIGG